MFNGGKTQFKTKVGALFSMLMVVSVLVYALNKFVSLVKREEANVKIDYLENYYESTYEYTTKENEFPLGYGLFKSYGKLPDDLSPYGELKAFYLTWDASTGTATQVETPVK